MAEYCDGKYCKKKETCIHHIMEPEIIYDEVDYSTMKSGNSFQKFFGKKMVCGDHAPYYFNYKHHKTDIEFIMDLMNEWKSKTSLDQDKDVLYIYRHGILTIFTNYKLEFKGENDVLMEEYNGRLKSKLKDYKGMNILSLYKPYVVGYTLKDGVTNVDDVAFVLADNVYDARHKLRDSIYALKPEYSIHVKYVKEITTEIYSKLIGPVMIGEFRDED